MPFYCDPDESCGAADLLAEGIVESWEPTDDDLYNRPGVEGGISYPLDDAPGSLGENDWRL